jgi:hypothetical protein
MLSRLPVPLSRMMAVTASSAKWSLSAAQRTGKRGGGWGGVKSRKRVGDVFEQKGVLHDGGWTTCLSGGWGEGQGWVHDGHHCQLSEVVLVGCGGRGGGRGGAWGFLRGGWLQCSGEEGAWGRDRCMTCNLATDGYIQCGARPCCH